MGRGDSEALLLGRESRRQQSGEEILSVTQVQTMSEEEVRREIARRVPQGVCFDSDSALSVLCALSGEEWPRSYWRGAHPEECSVCEEDIQPLHVVARKDWQMTHDACAPKSKLPVIQDEDHAAALLRKELLRRVREGG